MFQLWLLFMPLEQHFFGCNFPHSQAWTLTTETIFEENIDTLFSGFKFPVKLWEDIRSVTVDQTASDSNFQGIYKKVLEGGCGFIV